MEIKIKRYGKTFAKNDIQVMEEVIKKTKKFNWYFSLKNSVTCFEWEQLNAVKNQILQQSDCNLREQKFIINI